MSRHAYLAAFALLVSCRAVTDAPAPADDDAPSRSADDSARRLTRSAVAAHPPASTTSLRLGFRRSSETSGEGPGAGIYPSDGPFIISLSADTGTGGDAIHLYGIRFGTSGTVTLRANDVVVDSWADTEIVVHLPNKTSGGVQSLFVSADGKSSPRIPFAVQPSVRGVWPAVVRAGQVISIEGTNFGSQQNGSKIRIGGINADTLSFSMTHIIARVPASLHDGSVPVEVVVSDQSNLPSSVGVDAHASTPPMPTFVSLSFDDTLESQFQAGAALRSRGMLGTFYVNSTRIGKPGSMTLEQLRSLASDGHEIGGHTLNHLHLTMVDDGEQRRQACSDRARLIDLGFDVRSFAYPGGMENAAVRAVISDCGYRSGRLINGGIETVPRADPFALRVVAHTGPSSTLATMQSWVTKAEAKGGFVAIVFHGMCATCSPDPMEMALFEQFLDWLATRRARGTVVRTVNEMVGGSVAPVVWGPIPPPAEDGPNLLRNSSLEADANADGAPDCWVRGTPGSVSAWSGSNDAYDGVASQYLGAPFGGSYTDRRVNTVQDSGYCAPPIVPTRTYRISAYYKGSSRAALNAYYRDTDGFWQAWTGSPTFKASATWERASFTLPPAPANAEAIGMGIVASDAKELWVDAFTLEEVVAP